MNKRPGLRLQIKIFVNVIFVWAKYRRVPKLQLLQLLLREAGERERHTKTARKKESCGITVARREKDAAKQTFPSIEDDLSYRMSCATFPISIRRLDKNAYRLTRVNLHV